MLFFDPHINEIFFADKILLLEGQSEELISNLLIQEGKIDVVNVSIINAKSKYNIPTFINVFNSIKIPYCVIMDEDPYFLPHYKTINPGKLKNKRKAYKKTTEIIELLDESIGRCVVISPDFDSLIDLSNNKVNKYGKPYATHKQYNTLKLEEPSKIKLIIDLFNMAIKADELKYKAVDQNGNEWKFKNEKDVKIENPNFEDFKKLIRNILVNYKSIMNKLNEIQIKELQKLLILDEQK